MKNWGKSMKRFGLCCIIVCCFLLFSKGAFSEPFIYYLPYFTSIDGYFTGLALKNCDRVSSGATVFVHIYDNDGFLLSTQSKQIEPNGQSVYVAGNELNKEGWLSVSSTSPLVGLCFFGKTGSENYMADISLTSDLATELYVPHVAQSATWDTTIMVCNPHNKSNWVTLSYVDESGETIHSEDYEIQANGSLQCHLNDLVEGSSREQGSVEISSDLGIAAFALYENTKTGGYSYSGISAVVPPGVTTNDSKPYNRLMTEKLWGSWYFLYTDVVSHDRYYYLNGWVEEIPSEPGTYGLYGTDEHGDLVMAKYDPLTGTYALFDDGFPFNKLYFFNFTTSNEVVGCYFEVDDRGSGPCQQMVGNRIDTTGTTSREVTKNSQDTE
jgi:hypothetical protein